MIDVVALGEVLINFTPAGENEQGITCFACNPGGAPANVLAMNAKLGGKWFIKHCKVKIYKNHAFLMLI